MLRNPAVVLPGNGTTHVQYSLDYHPGPSTGASSRSTVERRGKTTLFNYMLIS